MNIEGLDYNTKREHLVMPEYGREVQSMVDYAMTIADKDERQRCATAIVSIMERMLPQGQNNGDVKQKLWGHIALISGFKLDIDYPCDISDVKKMADKPAPLGYPMKKIPVRHYGNMLFELFNHLKEMPDGPERDELIRQTANQMKRNLTLWGHGSTENGRVATDLALFTDGAAQINPDSFVFDKVEVEKDIDRRPRKKR